MGDLGFLANLDSKSLHLYSTKAAKKADGSANIPKTKKEKKADKRAKLRAKKAEGSNIQGMLC